MERTCHAYSRLKREGYASMHKKKLLWLVYRRMRPSIGTSLGFILMYAFLSGNFTKDMLLIAAGFTLIHLFGDCYDDCCNAEEDRRNGRKDKLILNGFVTEGQMRVLSFGLLFLGLLSVSSANLLLLIPAAWCSLLAFAYSHPRTRLKNLGIITYMLGGTVWVALFCSIELIHTGSLTINGASFIIFAFSQYVYILCQKDSTDRNDSINIFTMGKHGRPFMIMVLFAVSSSASLLALSASPALMIVWAINACSKSLNLAKIYRGTIQRNERGRLVLIEFLTPYAYILGKFF